MPWRLWGHERAEARLEGGQFPDQSGVVTIPTRTSPAGAACLRVSGQRRRATCAAAAFIRCRPGRRGRASTASGPVRGQAVRVAWGAAGRRGKAHGSPTERGGGHERSPLPRTRRRVKPRRDRHHPGRT